MKYLYTFSILLIVLFFLSSCQVNQSVSTDLITGATSRGNGVVCEDITIEIDGKVDQRNKFYYGERVNLIFDNVTGLTRSNGSSFPGLSMQIVKNEKDTVFSDSNLLKDFENGISTVPLQLSANFITALSYMNNEKYKVFIKIWDKKGDGYFTYELPFQIKENEMLNVKVSELEYSNIYLWNKTLNKPVINKKVSTDHQLVLIFEGVDGLEVKDEKVFPVLSLDLKDSKGNIILSDANLFSSYEDSGIDPKVLMQQAVAKITFTDGNANNPYTLVSKIKDKNSSREITVEADLEIN